MENGITWCWFQHKKLSSCDAVLTGEWKKGYLNRFSSNYTVKVKVKVLPITGHEAPEGEYRYISTLSWPRRLDEGWVGGQHHAPAALPPGKTRYSLYRRLCRPQSRSGRVRKISPPPGFDPRTVQPVASRYTDWAITAHPIMRYKW